MLTKTFIRIKFHLIFHDAVRCFCKLARKGIVRYHGIRLLHLAVVICPWFRIISPRTFCCLWKCPCKVFVPTFIVTFPFYLFVAYPSVRNLPAIRGIIACEPITDVLSPSHHKINDFLKGVFQQPVNRLTSHQCVVREPPYNLNRSVYFALFIKNDTDNQNPWDHP